MSNLDRLQERLREMQCHGILIPSTDDYLSEFVQPFAQRLQWITGFQGSTGLAILLQERAALFVDGRYKSQGLRDTEGLKIEVLEGGESEIHRWLAANLRVGQRLAIDGRLHPYPEMKRMLGFAGEHGIGVLELTHNPIDELWGGRRPAAPACVVYDYPSHFAGAEASEKCRQLREELARTGADCCLLADPEDVAWLLNVRTHDSQNTSPNGWHIVPIPLSRALVEVSGEIFWFVEPGRLDTALAERLEETMTVIDPARFESFLEERVTGKVVAAHLRRTPYRFAAIASRVGTLKDDPMIAHRRWRKHPNEIARAREGHDRDSMAVIRFLAWVQRTVPEHVVTEIEAARKLTELRKEAPEYLGLSMPLMSASGASGAMAHYVPSEHSNRRLNDHPIYWMDSGAQYYGCSTDNTVCIAVGEPEARHIRAHTLVVKGFIALATARFPAGIHSSQLDSLARQHLWQEGMDYGHGTGHGVGSFMNIHEGPYIRKDPNHPMVVPMQAGMIVSNEPAFYAEGDFGIRVESHLLTVASKHEGFLEFETLSHLPIDPRLIDERLLTELERQWLADYHRAILDAYRSSFDEQTLLWLQQIAASYDRMNRLGSVGK